MSWWQKKITYLNGNLIEISPTSITIDVNGIGYQLSTPLSSFDKLPQVGSQCKILTYLHVREDLMKLYGFITHEERDIFKLLIGISGIGPKMALTILSGMNLKDLKNAIVNNNPGLLSKTPGVGKKTAQRIIIELKERISGITIKTDRPIPKEEEIFLNDALRALVSLGYKQLPAQAAVEKALGETKGEIKLEPLLKKALKYL